MSIYLNKISYKIGIKKTLFSPFRTRHIQEVVSVYALTAVLTIAPLIANFVSEDTLDKCDVWRPRFGENKCFYSGMIKNAILLRFVNFIAQV